MRVPRVFAWAAAIAAVAVAREPPASATDSHGVKLPSSYAQKPMQSDGCDPSKWKLPVDGKYNTKSKVDPHKLNVHLIAHSHDDPYVHNVCLFCIRAMRRSCLT